MQLSLKRFFQLRQLVDPRLCQGIRRLAFHAVKFLKQLNTTDRGTQLDTFLSTFLSPFLSTFQNAFFSAFLNTLLPPRTNALLATLF
jgi:hypothetical protein